MNTIIAPKKALAKQAISSGPCIKTYKKPHVGLNSDVVNEADPLWTAVKLVLI
jgi:hypothetical protein